jgi:hypothetical protein
MNTRDFADIASKCASRVVERLWLNRVSIHLWSDLEAVVEQAMREAIGEALKRVAESAREQSRQERAMLSTDDQQWSDALARSARNRNHG